MRSVPSGVRECFDAAQVLAFCVFELCLGIFWPSMMTLRAQLVPEATRSTIINCFRIPLNLFVCVALFEVRAPRRPLRARAVPSS